MRIYTAFATIAVLLAAGLMLLSAQTTATPTQEPRDRSAILVELFTSEGCSSCPPADALLRQLNGAHAANGQRLIVLSEHVTYWNSLGWTDPFSAETYTQRQAAYTEKLRLDSAYTPQMVIGGIEQVVGSDRAGVERAIRKAGQQNSPASIRILNANPEGNRLQIAYATAGETKGAEIIAVLTDDTDQSSVQRGENSGRTLAHVSVARTLTRIGKATSSGAQSASVALPANLLGTPGHHLILFLQIAGQGRVLDADARPIG
ncbi:hypothetical protein SAMN05421770_103406 [Granulicella rosea]|uniref:DUF1223 domain-containing protein n=1 Tax=Granulicella rosea TaxID=474952 RepID=A0A239J2J5_9BACT|nr:DUF1223 domain-containing protein [Granulicella rosea]SNT00030.1 hypothetical protein SAMN05421770_103406 [Granulicella rosea]